MNSLYGIFEHVNGKDLIDILIVSLVVYNLLLIIRGTRAVQIVVGFLGIAILFWGSLNYKLYSLNWLLSHFFDSIFIIVVIIFQDQIRNALAMLGNTTIFGKSLKGHQEEIIEEVVMACKVLSVEKCGALIVIEKQHGLANYYKTGTILDSQIHSDILYAIFQPASPLHDGAVIISNGRIKAAGCFLPLAQNVEIDKHLGTRHRAALGTTDQTDAIVVTVSEETGRINVCFNGIFYLVESEQSLRRQLAKLMIANIGPTPYKLNEAK